MNFLFDEPEHTTDPGPGLDPYSLPNPPKWTAPSTLPPLSGLVAVDVETRDPLLMSHGSMSAWPHRADGYVIGVSVACGDFAGYYPLRHATGQNTTLNVIPWLREALGRADVEMVCANTPYDLAWLLRDGIDPRNDPWDVQGMAALLDENRDSYSLETLGQVFLGRGKESIAGFTSKIKEHLWRLDPAYTGAYAERDAAMLLPLHAKLWKAMQADNLQQVSDLERPCIRIATEMRMRGVRYDVDEAERKRIIILDKEKAYTTRIRETTGVSVSPNDMDSIARALATQGIVSDRTSAKQKKVSITASWLEEQKHPVASAIRELRRWNKARTSFLESHLEYAGSTMGRGRIHGEFNPLRRVEEEGGRSSGTVSGRFSGTNPNLQNIPARDPQVREMLRTLLLPEEDAEWGAADYSSQEPRLTVHFAGLAREGGRPLRGAADAVQAFCENPKLDLHQWTADMMNVSRKAAKAINLGIVYGMGGAKLCHELGLPTEWKQSDRGFSWEAAGPEGQALLDKHAQKVPYARPLADMMKNQANRQGYITTLLGRRCHWPVAQEGQRERPFAHKALNRLIQGSAADQMKAALVMLWREHREVPLVTVHDEVGFSCEGPAHLARIQHCMEHAVRLSVPTMVDMTTGPNWSAAKP